MKALFGMTAAMLLVVTMFFLSLPDAAMAADEAVQAAIKLFSKENIDRTKQMIDESLQAAKEREKDAKTEEEKRCAKQELEQMERIAKEFKENEKKRKELFRD